MNSVVQYVPYCPEERTADERLEMRQDSMTEGTRGNDSPPVRWTDSVNELLTAGGIPHVAAHRTLRERFVRDDAR